MDFNIEAPWVRNAPCEEAEEFFASKFNGEIVGCENCVSVIEAWEWED